MLLKYLDNYRCPRTGGKLALSGESVSGRELVSGDFVSPAGDRYPIKNGIANFLAGDRLTTVETRTMAEYDAVAHAIYDTAVDWQFAAFREDENSIRESMVDMLMLTPTMRVIEIGCGTGRDSFRIARRLDQGGYLHLQDLAPRMVEETLRRMTDVRERMSIRCELDYSVSSAVALPFADDSFDAVFHFGGINQFGDLAKGASELTRIVKPGGRVVFGDEAVAPWLRASEFARIVITNNPLFDTAVPLDILPLCARDVTVRWIIGNCFYVIGFTKGTGVPDIDLDLPHQGWRGGTMRTRYFGQLEGVTVDAKAMVRAAAEKSGVSVHAWLDRTVRRQAAADLGDSAARPESDRK